MTRKGDDDVNKIPNIVVVVFAMFMVGCAGTAGTSFQKLEINQLVYGSDTQESIKQKLGEPYKEGAVTKNDTQFKTMSYAYSSTGGDAAYKDVIAGRSQGFYFNNNKLVGHEFTSTWALDSTDFDESKIGNIKKGTTTVQQVVELLGKPGGEYVYPLVTNETEKAKVYLYQQTKGSVFNLKFYQEMLVVSYDENGIVTDVKYIESGNK